MSKESWFQSGLSEQIGLLQQRIRCMHEHELEAQRVAVMDSRTLEEESVDSSVRFNPSVQIYLPSMQSTGVISLGESVSALSMVPDSAGSPALESRAPQAGRGAEKVEFPPLQLYHPLKAQSSRSTDFHHLLMESPKMPKSAKAIFASQADEGVSENWSSVSSEVSSKVPRSVQPCSGGLHAEPLKSTSSKVSAGYSRLQKPSSPGKLPATNSPGKLLATNGILPASASSIASEQGSINPADFASNMSSMMSSLPFEHPLTSLPFEHPLRVGGGSFLSGGGDKKGGDAIDEYDVKPEVVRSRTLANLIKEAEDAKFEHWSDYLPARTRAGGRSSCCGCISRIRKWLNDNYQDDAKVAALDLVMGVVILLNCVLVAARMDTEEWPGWYTVEFIFTSVFVLEILIKLKFLGWRELFFGKLWHWTFFDILIIAFAVVDLCADIGGSITVFRVVRLGRTLRLIRLVKMAAVKELVMLLRGLVGGAKCLFWCLAFLSLPVFLVGMLLAHFLSDWEEEGERLFSSVPAAMFTTIRCMCGECTDTQGRPIIILLANARGWYFALAYSVFILVSIFGVFNLITAIFIEGTMQIAKSDTDLQRQLRQSSDKKFARNMKKLVFMFWQAHGTEDHRGRSVSARMTSSSDFDKFNITDAMDLEISQTLYDDLVSFSCVRDVMDDMGLQDDDIVDLFQMLDVDNSGTLDVNELVTGIHKLRGDATKRDLVALAYMIYAMQDTIRALSVDIMHLRVSSNTLEENRTNERSTRSAVYCAEKAVHDEAIGA